MFAASRALCHTLSLGLTLCPLGVMAISPVFQDRIIAQVGNRVLTETTFSHQCPSPEQEVQYFQGQLFQMIIDTIDLNRIDTQAALDQHAAAYAKQVVPDFDKLSKTEQEAQQRQYKPMLVMQKIQAEVMPSPGEIDKKLTAIIQNRTLPAQVKLRYLGIAFPQQKAKKNIQTALHALRKQIAADNPFDKAIRHYQAQHPDVKTAFCQTLTPQQHPLLAEAALSLAPAAISQPIAALNGIYLIQRLPNRGDAIRINYLYVPYTSALGHAETKIMLDAFCEVFQPKKHAWDTAVEALQEEYPDYPCFTTTLHQPVTTLPKSIQNALGKTTPNTFKPHFCPSEVTRGANRDELLLGVYYIEAYTPAPTQEEKKAHYYTAALQQVTIDKMQAYTTNFIRQAIADGKLYVHPDYQHLMPK